MLGGLFFVPMVGLLGIVIAWYRRDPRRFLDGPAEDAPLRLMRWAIGLLAPQRAEWGQAMLGELGYIEGRIRRMRFALGCAGAALVLPPWGRAAAGVWAMMVLAAGAIGLDAGMAVHYGLGGGDWIAVLILAVFVLGVLLGASALVRRPGVALPGLLGGLFIAVIFLTCPGSPSSTRSCRTRWAGTGWCRSSRCRSSWAPSAPCGAVTRSPASASPGSPPSPPASACSSTPPSRSP